MRYGILSDVHSNLEALCATTGAMAKDRIDRYLFVGDLVGYGADPRACIAAMRLLKPHSLIAGNHDWGVLGLLDMEYFNEYAASAVEWTRDTLSGADAGYLRSFMLVCEQENFTLVHGSLNQPAKFNYILGPEDARLCMRCARTPLCFVGHSHRAGIFCLDGGTVMCPDAAAVKIDYTKKYVINVGSVGQPRDGDPRASYAVYDETEGIVEIKRVIYDIEAAQAKITRAGLPAWLAARLVEGR